MMISGSKQADHPDIIKESSSDIVAEGPRFIVANGSGRRPVLSQL